ncbi:hypothetical protein B9Z19DRAFT_1173584, partial [Tuber borchii]
PKKLVWASTSYRSRSRHSEPGILRDPALIPWWRSHGRRRQTFPEQGRMHTARGTE